MDSCQDCGSPDLIWEVRPVPNSSAPVDGRLTLNDISVVAYLACDECGEVNVHRYNDGVADLLNQGRAFKCDIAGGLSKF